MSGQAKFSKLYHCVYALHYHLVMVTKYRRKCLTAPMLARFREIAAARCEGWGGKLLEVKGEPDHVHLLVSLPPNLDLSRSVNNLKTTTSRLIHKEFAVLVGALALSPVVSWPPRWRRWCCRSPLRSPGGSAERASRVL